MPEGPDAERIAERMAVDMDGDSAEGRNRPMLAQLVRDGEVVGREPLEEARARHRRAMDELPPEAHHLSRGYAAIPTIFAARTDEGPETTPRSIEP